MSNVNFAILLCKFSDDQGEPRLRKFYEMLFTHAGAGTQNLAQYLKDISHDHVDMTESQVFGWFTMNKEVSDYKGSGSNNQGRNDLINWARVAAGAEVEPFGNRVIVCINRQLETYGGGNGVVLDNAGLRPSVAAQEIIHNLGLTGHARQFGKGDYTDPWDVMSAATSLAAPDPLWQSVGPITNAANMDFLNWLDLTRVWQSVDELPPTDIALRPLARPDLDGYVAAKIGEFYVELRINEGWDAGISQPCILVHTFSDGHSYLMPGTAGQLPLLTGNRFSSHTGGVFTTIDVDAIDPVNHRATIRASRRSSQAPLSPGIQFGG